MSKQQELNDLFTKRLPRATLLKLWQKSHDQIQSTVHDAELKLLNRLILNKFGGQYDATFPTDFQIDSTVVVQQWIPGTRYIR